MKRIRKAISLVLAMIMVLALVPTALAAENTAPAEGAETTAADYDGWDTIKVFETTDVHGFLMDISTYEEATFQYRMAYIAKIVNDARANEDYAGVLLLDSGDIYQGNVISSKNDEGAPMRAAFDVMGYDAVGLGNHEFDKDVTKYAADEEGTMPAYNFGEYEGDSDIPVLMYNLYDAGTTNRVNFTQDYTVVEKGGYKVAILGYAGDYSEEIMASKIAPYDIDEDLEKLSARAAEVKEESEADILVILAHHSPDEIAAAMDPEVVDLVAGGHSHKNLTGVAENGVTYIQCRNQARNYATAEIKVNPETKSLSVNS